MTRPLDRARKAVVEHHWRPSLSDQPLPLAKPSKVVSRLTWRRSLCPDLCQVTKGGIEGKLAP